jgi:hypothetical protein
VPGNTHRQTKVTKITGKQERIRYFTEGFSEASPYWDKLSRLKEDNNITLEEIITSLVNYYSTNVCTTMTKKRDPDDGEEPAPSKHQRQGKGSSVDALFDNLQGGSYYGYSEDD